MGALPNLWICSLMILPSFFRHGKKIIVRRSRGLGLQERIGTNISRRGLFPGVCAPTAPEMQGSSHMCSAALAARSRAVWPQYPFSPASRLTPHCRGQRVQDAKGRNIFCLSCSERRREDTAVTPLNGNYKTAYRGPRPRLRPGPSRHMGGST